MRTQALRAPVTAALRRTRLVAWIVVVVSATGATAFAASVPVASKNLTVFKTCTLTMTSSISTAGFDSSVRDNAANGNRGTLTTMEVQSSSSSNRRSYVQFAVTSACSPAIPSSASVKLATLRLYATALPAACRTQDVFRATASWTETGITWNNQPFGTTLNNPPTVQRSSSINIGPSGCQNSAVGYVTGWDVTADVQAYVAASASNFGWMIRDDVENSASAQQATYSTRDAGLLAQSPQLIITYSV